MPIVNEMDSPEAAHSQRPIGRHPRANPKIQKNTKQNPLALNTYLFHKHTSTVKVKRPEWLRNTENLKIYRMLWIQHHFRRRNFFYTKMLFRWTDSMSERPLELSSMKFADLEVSAAGCNHLPIGRPPFHRWIHWELTRGDRDHFERSNAKNQNGWRKISELIGKRRREFCSKSRKSFTLNDRNKLSDENCCCFFLRKMSCKSK